MSLPEHLADLERRIRARHDGAVAGLRHEYEARLRRASEELLAALGEVRAPELEPLAGIDVAAFTPRASDREETLGDLLAGARAFDAAAGQAEVLDALLEAARRFAERVGLLLVRADGATGWASAGFDGDPFAGRELAWDDALPAPAQAGRGALRLDAAAARRFAERLGFASPAARAVLVPLVLRDQVAAALYADAAGAGAEPPLAALQLLVQLAAARLELQPLSERGYSPTLYESDAAPAAALALWSSAPPAPATAPVAPVAPVAEVAAPAVAAAPAWLEPAVEPVAPAPALPPPAVSEPAWAAPETPPVEPVREAPAAPTPWWSAPEPAPPAPEPVFEPVFEPVPEPAIEPVAEPAAPPASAPVESLFVAAAAEVEIPAEAPAFEPAAPPEATAPALEDSLWGAGARGTDAAEAGFAVEPEPAAAPPAAPRFAPEPEAAPGDATVRIPAYRPAPAAPPPAPLGLGTRQMPQFVAPPPAAPPPAPPADVTEDATVLMRGATAPIPIPPAPPAGTEEEPGDRTGVRTAARTTEVAAPPDVSGPGLAFAAGRAVRTVGENALHDEARRLARLLVSEIKLYNEEQVLEGRRNRDLYMRLKEDIDRSRQIYDERVHESVRSTTDYFHQELVRSLAGGDSRALGL